MNTFNRVVIVISLLALMVILTSLCIFPDVILENAGSWLSYWGSTFSDMKENAWQNAARIAIGIAIAVIVDIILAVLIFFEVRPKRKRLIRVKQVSGGMVTLNDTSIIQQLEYKLDPIPGVINVKPEIKARGNKVQAVVHVDVAAGVNVPSMALNLMDKVQSVLLDDLGLQVYKKPEVRIKVATTPGSRLQQPAQPPKRASTSEAPPLPASETAAQRERRGK